MREEKGCFQSFFVILISLFIGGLFLSYQTLWAKNLKPKTPISAPQKTKPVDQRFEATQINCSAAYGVVMSKAGENYQSPAYKSSTQARLRLIAELEKQDSTILRRIADNDELVEKALSKDDNLNKAVLACDKRFGYEVALGIAKPSTAYVIQTPVVSESVTFTNTEAPSSSPSSYRTHEETPAEALDRKCMVLLRQYQDILSNVEYQANRYNELVAMNSMPHMIEAQERLVGSSADSGARRMDGLINEASGLGCDSYLVGEWRSFRDMLKSFAYKY